MSGPTEQAVKAARDELEFITVPWRWLPKLVLLKVILGGLTFKGLLLRII